ncbi:MAG: alpha/beta hydrolase-fold protein, partial [Pseudomonadota bacterium]
MELRSSSTGFIAVALLTSISLCSAAGAKAQIEAASPQELEVLNYLPAIAGDYFRYESDAVGRGYHIYVSLPQSYGREPERTYPVVYVLDGDSLFPIIAPTHLFLTFDYDLPEAVIVGIAYGSFEPPINRRGFDYTVA